MTNDDGSKPEGTPERSPKAADLNLGITTYVNGTEMNPIQLDTTQAATDTIAYVATDSQGLTSTSTRTVIIQPVPSIVPSADASTTASNDNTPPLASTTTTASSTQ